MWQTIKQYADQHNVSPTAIYKRINKGTIATKIVKGLKMVSDNESEQQITVTVEKEKEKEDQNTAYQRRVQAKAKIENALKMQKLKNLRQDTILKKQKSILVKEQYRRQYCNAVFQCFTDSFADLKTMFIGMQLNKTQNAKLKEVFQKAIKKFQQKLLKYLDEADKKESDIENEQN